MAVVDVADVLEHEARDDRVEAPVGERQRRRAGAGVARSATALGRLRHLRASRVDTDDHARRRRRGARRAIWPSPQPTSSTRPAPARCRAASGRICSSYSGSAPVGEARPATSRRAPPTGRRRPPIVDLRAAPGPDLPRRLADAVDPLVDRVGHRVGQPRQRLELLEAWPPSRPSRRRAPSRAASCAPRRGPAMPSSTLVVIRLPRSSRWNVMAKRWASSRIRCSR